MRLRKAIRTKRSYRSRGVNVQSDLNATLAMNLGERGARTRSFSRQESQHQGGRQMSEKERIEPRDVSQEELEAEKGEELPDREAMSLINANLAAPVNAAVALNALSDNSVAVADATQTGDITQTA
jgi:hypothetical protein